MEGARHVADVNEVAALLPVLEHHGRSTVEQARSEDREDPGIGIGERLARTKHVEQAECHGLNAIGLADHQAHPFLSIFGQRVDRGEIRRLLLGCGDRFKRTPFPIEWLPALRAQPRRCPRHGDCGPAFG